jgi:hypothetical protein
MDLYFSDLFIQLSGEMMTLVRLMGVTKFILEGWSLYLINVVLGEGIYCLLRKYNKDVQICQVIFL